jgi:hypothetical protein
MNTTNGYADTRMNLKEVCQWLTNKGHSEVAEYILLGFSDHTWTKDGMLRKDVIEEIMLLAFDQMTFRQLECDVTTHMSVIPYHEAHVD